MACLKEATCKRENRVEMVPSVTSSHSTPPTTSQDHKCSVCLELFAEPKVLPCCHTFCLKCLKKTATTKGQITCPMCRASHKIPAGGLSEFLTDFIESYKAEVAGLSSSKSQSIICGECEQPGPVSYFCSDCQNYLCNDCGVKLHKRLKTYRGHKVTPIGEVDADTLQSCQVRYCSSHKGEALKLYCKTCKELVCRDCTLVKHRYHDYKFVQDARKDVEKEMASLESDVLKKLTQTRQNFQEIEKAELSATRHPEVLKADINQFFDDLVKSIESKRSALLQESESLCQKDLKQIWADKEHHEIGIASILAIFNLVAKARRCTNDSEMIITALQSIKQLKLIQGREWNYRGFVRALSFTPTFQRRDVLVDTFGSVTHTTLSSTRMEHSSLTSAVFIGHTYTITVRCSGVLEPSLINKRSGEKINLQMPVVKPQLAVDVKYGKAKKALRSSLITIIEKKPEKITGMRKTEKLTKRLTSPTTVYRVRINTVCGGEHTAYLQYGISEEILTFVVRGRPSYRKAMNKGPDWKPNCSQSQYNSDLQAIKLFSSASSSSSSSDDEDDELGTIDTSDDLSDEELIPLIKNSGKRSIYKWGKDGEYEVEISCENY